MSSLNAPEPFSFNNSSEQQGYAAHRKQLPASPPDVWFPLKKLPPRLIVIYFVWFYPIHFLVAVLFSINLIDTKLCDYSFYNKTHIDLSFFTRETSEILILIIGVLYCLFTACVFTYRYASKVLKPAVDSLGHNVNPWALNVLSTGKRYSKKKNSTYYYKSNLSCDIYDDGREMVLLIGQDRKHAILLEKSHAEWVIKDTSK
jgi:hypothetical protein